MGKLSRKIQAALVAAILAPTITGADTPDDPLRFFANCAGRMAAELSHRQMLAEPNTTEIAALRAGLLEILAAITPSDQARDVLNWRIEARAAHSGLLSRASFRGSTWAEERAAAEVAYCASFVIGPAGPPQIEVDAVDMPPMNTSQPLP